MTLLRLPTPLLAETLDRLREGGTLGHERVALWLARSASSSIVTVCEVYDPEQETAKDFFYLAPESLLALMSHLRRNRLKVAAQIHTHPARAFHSNADDTWAIVRHVGALSLVLPDFAATTTLGNFLDQVKIYRLSESNEWTLTGNRGPNAQLVIHP